MTFMCEYNIRTKNIWDYYSPVPHRNKEYIPMPIKRKRPNSKITKTAIIKNQSVNKIDDILSNSVSQQNLISDQLSQEQELPELTSEELPVTTTLFSIMEDYDVADINNNEDIKSDENNITSDLGTWTILKLIENVFTIAFLKQ